MIRFSCIAFDQLSVHQLYEIMTLRQEVFVVEQNCPYLDADGADLTAWHLTGHSDNGNLIAYARLIPPGISYPDHCSFGRVTTARHYRGRGIGRELMLHTMKWMGKLFPGTPVKISAQTYLCPFYKSLNFRPVGEEYLEDGIPHVAMVYLP